MEKLVKGFLKFRTEVFRKKKKLFTWLSENQAPRALFITCSDSRVDPTLLTQTDPGELFICLLYTSPSPRDRQKSRMPSSA